MEVAAVLFIGGAFLMLLLSLYVMARLVIELP